MKSVVKKQLSCVGMLLFFLLVLLAVPMVQNFRRYNMRPIDALAVPLFDGTKWASGYSARGFNSIDVGMTKTEVRHILGECLAQKDSVIGDLWHYTIGKDGQIMSASEHSTHLRIVHFDTNGLVDRKTYSFYFD